MNYLVEILAHIDAPTRAEVLRYVRQQDREIEHLKEQYRQLQEVSPMPEPDTIGKIITRAKSDIASACNRAGECAVFYDSALKRFKVVTQEARIAVASRSSELVGVYKDGYERGPLTEDLYTALESSGVIAG